tara:strand:- start:834 stop:1529 length:696 start_codon:yes stop_codon:yes gene_type:complete
VKVKFVTTKQNLAKTIDQWITPAFPSWFKDLKVSVAESIQNDFRTVRHCPAFVHLFKNAHVLRAPQDISLLRQEDGTIGSRQPNEIHQLSVGLFNFQTQMGDEWKKFSSVKVDFNGTFVPEESMTGMFFDPIYHQDERCALTAMTGVWPMHPELYTHLAINLMGQRQCFDDEGYLHINRGTPLAYLYWPQGKPVIEPEVVSIEEYERDYLYVHTNFVGDFIKKEKELTNAV